MERSFPKYDEKAKEVLKTRYTPKQLEAIEAGEEAIKAKDLATQARFRHDPMALEYLEDLSKTKPAIDRRRHYDGPLDPNGRAMNDEERFAEYKRAWLEVEAETPEIPKLKEEDLDDEDKVTQYNKDRFPSRLDHMKIDSRMRASQGTHGSIPNEQDIDYNAPGLPKNFEDVVHDPSDPSGMRTISEESGTEEEKEPDPRDPDGTYDKLIKATGLTLDEIFSYKIKILVNHTVANQTRLGKIRSNYYLAICGNGNGKLGIGEAKGESEDTANMAKLQAIKNMKFIPRYENRTIFGDIEGKKSAVRVQLMARPPGTFPSISCLQNHKLTVAGFGLRCQHLIFEMCRACGIQDIAARVPKARNPMNTVKAVYQALLTQRLPEDIARARGKKLVDVRKVYYGGQT